MVTYKEPDIGFPDHGDGTGGGQVQSSYTLKMETAGFSEMLINFCQFNAGHYIPEERIVHCMY
jgi:hypothetical protein